MGEIGASQILVDSADLLISYVPGPAGNNAAVMSFSGIGNNPAETQRPEFSKTIAMIPQDFDVYYIVDKGRTWFNATADEILAILLPRIAGRRIFTVGNSMGGFGAILFGHLIPDCEAALAFSPQFSVNREIMRKERRWANFTTRITNWRYLTCIPEPASGVKTIIFQGQSDLLDVLHTHQFDRTMTLQSTIFLIKNVRHECALYLRDKKLLHRIFDQVITHAAGRAEIEALLDSGDVKYRPIYRKPPPPKIEPAPEDAQVSPAPVKRRMDYVEAWYGFRAPASSPNTTPAIEVLVDDANLYIARRPGAKGTRTAVLAFSSAAANPKLPQRRNFAADVAQMQVDFDLYFIIDKNRAWFNNIASQILDTLKPHLAGRKVFTIGNNIGGFGAILFSNLLPHCHAAIALDPQYSMHREVIRKERRWASFFNKIDKWRYFTCIPEQPAERPIFIFYSQDSGADHAHVRQFIREMPARSHLFVLDDCEHDSTDFLLEKDLLPGMVRLVMDGATVTAPIEAMLKDASVNFRIFNSRAAATTSRLRKSARPAPPKKQAGAAAKRLPPEGAIPP